MLIESDYESLERFNSLYNISGQAIWIKTNYRTKGITGRKVNMTY